ncbi:MAG: LPS export ABC transporter permease LptF [Deltaproteobacteria bacterium]|nr:LPS export ABC transporter permease LptF [Deltaproteobacteria bacterium]
MLKIIDRYILREITFPFFMIVFVLTFVLLMGKILQLMDLMINKGVSFFDISRLFLYLMPSFLVFTIPISLLVSILIGLGRLSGDNEITIFKASGISPYKILYPVAIASLIAFVITAAVSLYLVPHSKFATKNLLFAVAKKKASVGIKEKVFNDDFKGILLYAENIPVHGNFMEGVIVSDARFGREPNTIIAQRAYLVSDPGQLSVTLRLEKGSTHTVDTNLKNYRKMDFSVYDVNLDIESSLAEEKKARTKTSAEMTFSEIAEKLRAISLKATDSRELILELNRKIAVPFACLVFGILGVPLGIRSHRAVKARGFTVGLFTVLIYYLLRIGGEALVETGRLSPFIGSWAPNVIFLTVGIYLLIRTAQDKAIDISSFTAFLRKLIPGGEQKR